MLLFTKISFTKCSGLPFLRIIKGFEIKIDIIDPHKWHAKLQSTLLVSLNPEQLLKSVNNNLVF